MSKSKVLCLSKRSLSSMMNALPCGDVLEPSGVVVRLRHGNYICIGIMSRRTWSWRPPTTSSRLHFCLHVCENRPLLQSCR